MNRQDLAAIGKYLYGEAWKSPLANALKVNRKTITRWLSGYAPVNEGAANDIYKFAAAKQLEAAMPILNEILEKNGKPEVIELTVCKDDNVSSIHARPWSNEADYHIKCHVAQLMTNAGFEAKVV